MRTHGQDDFGVTRHQVDRVVGAAPLPRGAGQGRADRGDQAGVGVAGDQLDPGQAAGEQAAEERQPAGAVLGGGDVQAEDLPVPVGVDAGRDQRVHADDAAALADLEHQRVGRHERVRALLQRPGAERLDLLVQLRGHDRDLRLGQRCHAEGLDQLLHPPGRHPQQVRGRHHTDQGPFGAGAALQQPVREIAARPQLRDRHVDRAGPGVEVPVPVPVAGVHPLRAAFAVAGAAHRVRLGAHQRLDERRQHRTQQIRARRRELVGQHTDGSIGWGCGHRVVLLRKTLRGLRRITRWPSSLGTDTPNQGCRTPPPWTQLPG